MREAWRLVRGLFPVPQPANTGVSKPDEQERLESARLLYQAATQLWFHAEQIRWTLLYNYLLLASIIVVAWATLFAASHKTVETWYVMEGLCLVGAAISVIWTALVFRSSLYIDSFRDKVVTMEKSVSRESIGPFQAREIIRTKLWWLVKPFQSKVVTVILPICLVAGFILLFTITVRVALRPV